MQYALNIIQEHYQDFTRQNNSCIDAKETVAVYMSFNSMIDITTPTPVEHHSGYTVMLAKLPFFHDNFTIMRKPSNLQPAKSDIINATLRTKF